jgi:hypothetical protein
MNSGMRSLFHSIEPASLPAEGGTRPAPAAPSCDYCLLSSSGAGVAAVRSAAGSAEANGDEVRVGQAWSGLVGVQQAPGVKLENTEKAFEESRRRGGRKGGWRGGRSDSRAFKVIQDSSRLGEGTGERTERSASGRGGKVVRVSQTGSGLVGLRGAPGTNWNAGTQTGSESRPHLVDPAPATFCPNRLLILS